MPRRRLPAAARRRAAVLLAALFAGAGSAAAAAEGELPRWIEGCWSGSRGDQFFHEQWTVADPTTMLSVAFTLSGGRLRAFEFVRIVVRDGAVVYVAQPGGAPPTEFTASAQSSSEIVFENPAHDFPKRVVYRLLGANQLTAWIDGGEADRGSKVEYPMTRRPCDG